MDESPWSRNAIPRSAFHPDIASRVLQDLQELQQSKADAQPIEADEIPDEAELRRVYEEISSNIVDFAVPEEGLPGSAKHRNDYCHLCILSSHVIIHSVKGVNRALKSDSESAVHIKPFPKGLTLVFIRCGLTSRLRHPRLATADSELQEYPVVQCHILLSEAPHLEIRHRTYRDDGQWDESKCYSRWDEKSAEHNKESRRKFSLRLRELVEAARGEVGRALEVFDQR